MKVKKIIFYLGVYTAYMIVTNFSLGASSLPSDVETKDYKEDMAHIEAMRDSIDSGQIVKLEEYEKFADEIQKKWSLRNKEYNARIILELCGPLSSGTFPGDRRYDVAKKYALSVLDKPEQISIEMELELTGHVVTLMYTPNSPKGEDFSQRRKKDVEVRLHAWKRLTDAIDPNWDPNEVILSPNAVAVEMGLPGSVEPQAIEDPILRAEYIRAIEANMQKSEKYREQNSLHKWLKRFPRNAETYIIQAYSRP